MFKVELNGSTAVVNGETFNISEISTGQNTAISSTNTQPQTSSAGETIIKAPTPGIITKVLVQVGQQVQPDTDVCIVEVMKMETFVKACTTGTIKEINVQSGTQVTAGQQIAKTA